MKNAEVYIFERTREESLLKNVTVEKYIPIDKDAIEFKWEEVEVFYDGCEVSVWGFRPYVDNKFREIYTVSEELGSMQLMINYNTECLYKDHYEMFNLTEPQEI